MQWYIIIIIVLNYRAYSLEEATLFNLAPAIIQVHSTPFYEWLKRDSSGRGLHALLPVFLSIESSQHRRSVNEIPAFTPLCRYSLWLFQPDHKEDLYFLRSCSPRLPSTILRVSPLGFASSCFYRPGGAPVPIRGFRADTRLALGGAMEFIGDWEQWVLMIDDRSICIGVVNHVFVFGISFPWFFIFLREIGMVCSSAGMRIVVGCWFIGGFET